MVEKLKVRGFGSRSVSLYNGNFTGFECPSVLIPHALKKVLSSFVGVKSVPLLNIL